MAGGAGSAPAARSAAETATLAATALLVRASRPVSPAYRQPRGAGASRKTGRSASHHGLVPRRGGPRRRRGGCRPKRTGRGDSTGAGERRLVSRRHRRRGRGWSDWSLRRGRSRSPHPSGWDRRCNIQRRQPDSPLGRAANGSGVGQAPAGREAALGSGDGAPTVEIEAATTAARSRVSAI